MPSDYDVIIIGAGLGGLVCGAKLCKEGKKVLILEQHGLPGGYATTFKRKDFTFEASLHEMDGLNDSDTKKEIFEDLGIYENVELIKVKELYRFYNKRVDFVLPDNREEAIKVLSDKFPDERNRITKFFKVLQKTAEEINVYSSIQAQGGRINYLLFPIKFPYLMKYGNKTLGKVLDSIIKNEDLKLILLGNIHYFAEDPYSMAFSYYSIGQDQYFCGAHYFKNGSQSLADYLAKFISNHGGEILYNHLAKKIIVENKKAVGVQAVNLSLNNKNQTFKGKYIVANAALPNVINNMLDVDGIETFRNKISKLKPSMSAFCIYFGFNKDLAELGCNNYTTIILDEKIKNQKQILVPSDDYNSKMIIFVNYSHLNTNLAPEGKSVGSMFVPDFIDNWQNLSNEEYKLKKEELVHLYLDKLDKMYPGIKESVEYYEASTPKTFERYTLNPGGSIYGYAQLPSQAGDNRLNAKLSIPVDNLYFSSAWVLPGGGFTGTMISGWICAYEILGN